ncbi:hypothetical protein P3102_19175 [Amycolatopsis sp. QT-25]|uniref:hypothetical protein n=1 Tax=Amycolatopsis sp. QT-25 TaxID=3034022 RepID=UPI0023EA9888|nr:hypothetical protein [Amycolatopsis sp. QT-25]WET76257.1 hypothetical protein P3102_19175 [Amycolatopsis sp. QT-25]
MSETTVTAGKELAALATEYSRPMRKLLTEFGSHSLGTLVDHLRDQPSRGWQPRDDFVRAVHREATGLYGAATADAARRELLTAAAVPTANHFGVDTFADSVQGTLLLASVRPDSRRHALVVLGFGSISMNNLTYPMGLRLYDDPGDGALERIPLRLPVLPNRVKRSTVRAAGPWDRTMLIRALARLRDAAREDKLTPFTARSAAEVLSEHYGDDTVLGLPGYAEQAARVTSALWRRLSEDSDMPPLVSIQIEDVCSALLEEDLLDPSSLATLTLFEPATRLRLLSALDSRKGCWKFGDPPGGTVFFWALDTQGRRVPLTMTGLDQPVPRLVGGGAAYDFTPAAVLDGLRTGSLLPSLFTCFLTLAFARGIPCVGGYFQAEYLPVMQRGLLEALSVASELSPVAEAITRVPVDLCLAGLQGVTRILGDGSAIPAGPVEIAGAGGLSSEDLGRLRALPVRDACLLAFTEMLPHVVPPERLPDRWRIHLARENAIRPGIRLRTAEFGHSHTNVVNRFSLRS